MANKYIKSIEDFSINYKVMINTTFSVYDTSDTEYDEGFDENDIVLDINNGGADLILDKILSGCVIPKAISEIDIKGYDRYYKNFVCLYNTETQLKTVFSVEYDIKDFSGNENFGLKSDIKVGGVYTHPNVTYSLKVLKSTYGRVGTFDYINKIGKFVRPNKPILIKLGNGRVENGDDFNICELKV
jgi:hypothetical protein